MNDMNHNDELDILITRIVDNEANDEDWRRLQELGAKDQAVLRRLAQEQQMHALLCSAARPMLDASDRVETPRVVQYTVRSPWGLRFGAGLGWAVAAALTMAWLIMPKINPPVTTHPGSNTGPQLVDAAFPITADDAYQAYLKSGLQEGRVVGQLPTRMIEVEPSPDGKGYMVLYVRPILERQRVNDLYKYGPAQQDEDPATRTIPASFTESQTY